MGMIFLRKEMNNMFETDTKLVEKLKRIIKNDCDMLCSFCNYDDDCSHGVACYGGEPSYPPCSDGEYDGLINWESVEEYEEEVE